MSRYDFRSLRLSQILRSSLHFLTFLACSAAPLLAQGEASLSGTVRDVSGGSVPGVLVEIRNLETGAQRRQTTDEAGRYDAAALSVGRYEVRAEKPGFRSEVRTGIALVVGQRASVDLVLQVGDVKQTIEVAASPTIVAVTTEDLSGLIGERQLKDLPLNGRSYDQLLTL